ncbi:MULTISPECIES: LLM class flavin-dependent oxidoreductase [Mycobacterium]|uniref:Luciferase family protein n=1 Tax=Mycobacterium indicus pranii (strain DSM 45239 / MTCC 9506) TaxID=1232724 RepID=J9W809_MYCIP|nr:MULTISPECIES: LLM class flavin-dependent oxidoreductase [Mycobacterium]AFS12193.1 Luciferase family protein [Mycobacterium intracellulare subsp. intracellulare MTCC 9506]QWY63542.1 LLM class flavin-dependent oxidoreductase [Mycobacterium avium subsp. hominissuis]WSE51344.1 LLM class flavin-dependent oxidoreductase [Mycobacterium sp. 2-64]BCO49775.1 N5,N10-methylene tetrahydromethanopterin reductase [Mycobacterium paraintracellulare]BCO81870.1 N5,N10-methylene tetrahydromethanopterin reducta
MNLSLMSLGDVVTDPVTGATETAAERHRGIVEAAVAADGVGFHGIHIGEHHGLEYTTSAPPVILSAIGERTEHLRLSTAVTLVANLDPIRVAEDYATVDALSGGRCEVVAGRGNFFVSTYTLFGNRLEDSHELFAENIELLTQLWAGKKIDWPGSRHRGPIDDFVLQPAPVGAVPLWIGGGASESSLELAARLGLDLMLPSAFGNPEMFKPVVESYLEKFASYGHSRQPRVGACWHVNVAESSQAARQRWEPRYHNYFELMKTIICRVNPDPPPFIKKPFDFEFLTTRGPAIVGSPAEVADRLNTWAQLLSSTTNLIYIDMGGQPAGEFREMVELIGSAVIPQLD